MSRFNQSWRDVNGDGEDELMTFASIVFFATLGFLFWASFLCLIFAAAG